MPLAIPLRHEAYMRRKLDETAAYIQATEHLLGLPTREARERRDAFRLIDSRRDAPLAARCSRRRARPCNDSDIPREFGSMERRL